jgi:hypothetical protein
LLAAGLEQSSNQNTRKSQKLEKAKPNAEMYIRFTLALLKFKVNELMIYIYTPQAGFLYLTIVKIENI